MFSSIISTTNILLVIYEMDNYKHHANIPEIPGLMQVIVFY